MIETSLENNISFQIGHLNPVTVSVSGYGVFPQVYLSVPRPAMLELPAIVCYEGVAAITMDFLEYVEDIKVWCGPEDHFLDYEIPHSEKKALKRDGWVVITRKVCIFLM